MKNKINEMSYNEKLEMVKNDGIALMNIKEQTYDLCLEAVRCCGMSLKYVKNKFRTKEICKEAIKQDGYALMYIKNQTYELCLEAIKQTGWAIQFVKQQFRTEELYTEAIKQNASILEYIKDKSIDLSFYTNIHHTSHRTIYVTKPKNVYLFTVGCRNNMTKEEFIDRIYNTDKGINRNPHRKEYLSILEQY